jgi:hypothetical protein
MNWTTVQDNTRHVQSTGLDRQPNPLGLSCPVVQAEKERDDAAFKADYRCRVERAVLDARAHPRQPRRVGAKGGKRLGAGRTEDEWTPR